MNQLNINRSSNLLKSCEIIEFENIKKMDKRILKHPKIREREQFNLLWIVTIFLEKKLGWWLHMQWNFNPAPSVWYTEWNIIDVMGLIKLHSKINIFEYKPPKKKKLLKNKANNEKKNSFVCRTKPSTTTAKMWKFCSFYLKFVDHAQFN